MKARGLIPYAVWALLVSSAAAGQTPDPAPFPPGRAPDPFAPPLEVLSPGPEKSGSENPARLPLKKNGPLKTETRKPRPVSHKNQAARRRPNPFRLTGILIPAGPSRQERVAMVEDASGRGRALKVGSSMGRWRVAAIHNDRVVMEMTRDPQKRRVLKTKRGL
ncbi:exported hypothetical protein [Candidatus Desulfarcum epimagneticum]|uniref:Pilus assembly protein PilP n=1 Tax=uncultured Desulfobacteraceae bacterium TaxID=218296 RepID=A0A484HG71_9BACT|nr:exported hypothetical protein [uncultured Desulfobacteraceae bacterium]